MGRRIYIQWGVAGNTLEAVETHRGRDSGGVSLSGGLAKNEIFPPVSATTYDHD